MLQCPLYHVKGSDGSRSLVLYNFVRLQLGRCNRRGSTAQNADAHVRRTLQSIFEANSKANQINIPKICVLMRQYKSIQ